MSRFLQQRLAELFSLVIGKSQAHASLNMTDPVLPVILYRAFFWFARGAEKKTLIKRGAAIGLRCLELGSGEATFLTVFHAEIFLLGLVLPLAPFIQRAHCK